MEILLCDFCSTPLPTWSYPSPRFIICETDSQITVSEPGWCACDICHEMIEANQRDALVSRSLATLPFPADEQLFDWLKDLHRKFFDHRCGPASRLHPFGTC